jgi:hypothetical protein
VGSGVRDGLTPSWEATQAICDFEMTQVTADSFVIPPIYPTSACVDAVVADFGLDTTDEDALAGLLWAAHALLTTDLGPVDEMQGAWVSPSFRRALAGPERAPVNVRLYDYVTSRIEVTLAGTRTDAAAGLQGDTLFLYDLPPGIDGAAVLVHEARHHDGFEHVLCGGEAVCDEHEVGAWGFELAVHELARDHSVDELARDIEQSWLEVLPERIVEK